MRMRAVVLLVVLVGCAGHRAADLNRQGFDKATARDWRGAADLYAQAISADPGSPKYHSNLAGAVAHLGYLQQAQDEYRAALKLDPGYRDAAYGLEVVTHAVQSGQAAAIADELRP